MARYKNGINGPVSGKVGSVIASSWRGIDYVKSLQEGSAKRGTDAQLRQRKVLGLVNSWLKPIRDLVWIGFQVFTGTRTPMNGAVSLIMKEAVRMNGGEPEISFPDVVLSRGELQPSWIREVIALAGAVLHIGWENGAPSAFSRDEDQAIFILYSPSKAQFVTFKEAAVRADGEVRLQLPADFAGSRVHGYLFYRSEAGNRVSTSQYLGEVTIN